MRDVDQEELEQALQRHFDAIVAEIERRDEWLINSIWNVVRSLNIAFIQIGTFGVAYFNGWTAWWQILLAAIIGMAGSGFMIWRMDRHEEDDKRRIARGGWVDKFYLP